MDLNPLAHVAAGQSGRISTAQLDSLGYSRGQIERLVRNGSLFAEHEEVYAVGHPGRTQVSGWWSAILAVREGTRLSGGSAAEAWGIGREGPRIEVTHPLGCLRLSPSGVVVHRTRLVACDHAETRGIPVCGLERTLLDLAATRGEIAARRAFEQAQVVHRLKPRDVAAYLAPRAGERGVARLRAVIEGKLDPGLVESIHELLLFDLCARYGLPLPSTGVRFGRWTFDFWWPRQRVALECQSKGFHSHLAAAMRDPVKKAWLEAQGVTVLLVWRSEVEHTPGRVAERLAAHLLP